MNEQQSTDTDEQQPLPFDPPLDLNPAFSALATENEELKKTIRLRDARESVTKALESAGATSPELLFESVAEKLQFDSTGAVQNAAALVALLKQSYPEQFGTAGRTSIDAGTGIGRSGTPLTREALAGMTPNQIARLDWADVRQVLSN